MVRDAFNLSAVTLAAWGKILRRHAERVRDWCEHPEISQLPQANAVLGPVLSGHLLAFTHMGSYRVALHVRVERAGPRQRTTHRRAPVDVQHPPRLAGTEAAGRRKG